MTKIRNIDISRFRGIHSLQIYDLNGVNVFLGSNNCGKSYQYEKFNYLLDREEEIR